MRMVILVILKCRPIRSLVVRLIAFFQTRLRPPNRGIPWAHTATLRIHESEEEARRTAAWYGASSAVCDENGVVNFRDRIRELDEEACDDGLCWLPDCPRCSAWSKIKENVTTGRVLQTDGPPRSDLETGCWTHPDREPKFMINNSTIYLCAECAEDHRDRGLHVRPIFGFMFGYPVLSSEDDGILDARIISDE